MKRKQIDNKCTTETLNDEISLCSILVKNTPLCILHVLMYHHIGVINFCPQLEAQKYKITGRVFINFLEHLRLKVDDHGSITTEHLIFQDSGNYTMSLLGSGILDGRLKTLSVHMTSNTNAVELCRYINRNMNTLQKVLIRQKIANSHSMLWLMRECNCNFQYRFIKNSMTLTLNINTNEYSQSVECNDGSHRCCIDLWKDVYYLASVMPQDYSPDIYNCSITNEAVIAVQKMTMQQPISMVPVRSILRDALTSPYRKVDFKTLESDIHLLPVELQEHILSFLPFDVRFQIAKYLKMNEVYNVTDNINCKVSRWYNVLGFFKHGNNNTVACNINVSRINEFPTVWLHIFFDCHIVHIQDNWDLPENWFALLRSKLENIKLRHLSTVYNKSIAKLLDSKILDGNVETLVLSLKFGYDVRPLIRFLNRKNSIKRLVLIIKNQLFNVIYTILKKCNIIFDYQMAQNEITVLKFKSNEWIYVNDENVLGQLLNVRLGGIWCKCKYSTTNYNDIF